MKKKIVLLLVCISMFSSMFMGCSSNNNSVKEETEITTETEVKEVESIELTLDNWEEYFEIDEGAYIINEDAFGGFDSVCATGVSLNLKDEYIERLTEECNVEEIAFEIQCETAERDVWIDEEAVDIVFGEAMPIANSEIIICSERVNDMRPYVDTNQQKLSKEAVWVFFAMPVSTVEMLNGFCVTNTQVTKVKGTLEFYK